VGAKALDPRNKPPVSLGQAWQLAQRALGRNSGTYYCISAEALTPNDMRENGWTFVLGSRSGKRRWVIVLANQRVIIRDREPSASA
jgi:hypothetical protein